MPAEKEGEPQAAEAAMRDPAAARGRATPAHDHEPKSLAAPAIGQWAGWSSCSGHALCAPDGNIIFTLLATREERGRLGR